MSSGTEEPTVFMFPVIGSSCSFESLVICYFSKRNRVPKIGYFDSHCCKDPKFHITSRLLNDRFRLKTKLTVVYHRTFRLTLQVLSQFNTCKLLPHLFVSEEQN